LEKKFPKGELSPALNEHLPLAPLLLPLLLSQPPNEDENLKLKAGQPLYR
jgi:hypothetical protein